MFFFSLYATFINYFTKQISIFIKLKNKYFYIKFFTNFKPLINSSPGTEKSFFLYKSFFLKELVIYLLLNFRCTNYRFKFIILLIMAYNPSKISKLDLY